MSLTNNPVGLLQQQYVASDMRCREGPIASLGTFHHDVHQHQPFGMSSQWQDGGQLPAIQVPTVQEYLGNKSVNIGVQTTVPVDHRNDASTVPRPRSMSHVPEEFPVPIPDGWDPLSGIYHIQFTSYGKPGVSVTKLLHQQATIDGRQTRDFDVQNIPWCIVHLRIWVSHMLSVSCKANAYLTLNYVVARLCVARLWAGTRIQYQSQGEGHRCRPGDLGPPYQR